MTETVVFTPFEPAHLAAIADGLAGPLARYADRLLAPDLAGWLVTPGLSWTGLAAGRPIGCAGVHAVWPGRAQAWALFADVPRRAWPAITAKVEEVMLAAHAAGHRRIETTVLDGFAAGHRWARRCGFVCETPAPMRGYGPDGSDHFLYARVAP